MKKKNLLMTAIAIFGLATITFGQTVPSYIPTTGLVGWWPFNGNANDGSGNGNNGTVNGATLTPDRFGNSNSAYSFNGISSVSVSGNNINVTNNFFDTGLNAFTISTWSNSNIQDNTSNGGAVQQIVHTNNAAGLGIACNWGSSNKYSIWAMSNPPASWDILYNKSSISNFVINQWKHIVMVKNNMDYSIYIDGILDTTFTTTITAQSYLTGLKFGTYWTGEEAFNGKLDDFGVWNRALTPQEILDLYNGCQLSVNTQPINQSVNISNNAQFTTSSSDPLATYQWQTDLGVGFQNLNSVGLYSGTTNDTLTVSNVTLSNNNQPFRCIISSGSCSDTSNVAVLTVNNNTGINEVSQSNLFSVYPNPAKSQINVKADAKLLGSVYNVYDNTGKLVLSGKINSENTVIELGNLSGGIYLFSVGENLKQTFKVIKQ